LRLCKQKLFSKKEKYVQMVVVYDRKKKLNESKE
jgi:hypothetical protein